MNGRINSRDTPWGRIAAVAKSLCIQMETRHRTTRVGPEFPDYADFSEAFEPFIKLELLRARIDEARKVSSANLTARMRELEKQVRDLHFPDNYQL